MRSNSDLARLYPGRSAARSQIPAWVRIFSRKILSIKQAIYATGTLLKECP